MNVVKTQAMVIGSLSNLQKISLKRLRNLLHLLLVAQKVGDLRRLKINQINSLFGVIKKVLECKRPSGLF